MESSFYFIPKETSPPVGGFTHILNRIQLINGICDQTVKGYTPKELPDLQIVDLCRLCIIDVCRELEQRINWETTRYLKYTQCKQDIKNGKKIVCCNQKEFLSELQAHILESKYFYNKYKTLYDNLKKKILHSSECIICKKTKN